MSHETRTLVSRKCYKCGKPVSQGYTITEQTSNKKVRLCDDCFSKAETKSMRTEQNELLKQPAHSNLSQADKTIIFGNMQQ